MCFLFLSSIFAPLRSFCVLRESVCAFASGAGRRFLWRERHGVPRYPAFPRICIGIGAMHGFCAYRGRRDAHFLFGTGMWWSGLGGELGITNGPGSASSLSLASLLLVNLLTTVPWFLQAALALRSLCDAKRRALASRIDAFAEVQTGLGGVPDPEKGKVLQSIASVIQALPPAEAVAPVEAMVGPILQRLGAALGAVGRTPRPRASRRSCSLRSSPTRRTVGARRRTRWRLTRRTVGPRKQTRCAQRGRTRACRFIRCDRAGGGAVERGCGGGADAQQALQGDHDAARGRVAACGGVAGCCAGRRLNGVWLALAAILIAQLNPPPLILTLKSGPSEEAEAGVREAVGGLVTAALGLLGAPGGMVENPDIVQEFFACMDRVVQDFTAAFCALPDGAFDALMQCAISALALQERYSLVAAATFLALSSTALRSTPRSRPSSCSSCRRI
ncbi:hypothetical protein B0H13DRAFT_2470633 [Mycena leptocephala]|nr:hypothetical protein B0H13DRAFT_2470633 [Mycena leptocephala]